MPLPVLVRAASATRRRPRCARRPRGLRHVSVRCVNLGVGRENLTDKHWIYYPEDTVFHRIFVQGNASPHCNPPGGFGLTCEITYSPHKPLPCDGDALIQRCIEDCRSVGIFAPRRSDLGAPTRWTCRTRTWSTTTPAPRTSRSIRDWLAAHDIVLAGPLQRVGVLQLGPRVHRGPQGGRARVRRLRAAGARSPRRTSWRRAGRTVERTPRLPAPAAAARRVDLAERRVGVRDRPRGPLARPRRGAVRPRRSACPSRPRRRRAASATPASTRRCWYRPRVRRADARPRASALLLHFGAVDYEATVWVERPARRRARGRLHAVQRRHHRRCSTAAASTTIVVRADDDPHDLAKPRGKQDWQLEPHSIWYPRTTGIWQTVWLERVPATRIGALRWTPNLERWEIGFEARARRRRAARASACACSCASATRCSPTTPTRVVGGEVHRAHRALRPRHRRLPQRAALEPATRRR